MVVIDEAPEQVVTTITNNKVEHSILTGEEDDEAAEMSSAISKDVSDGFETASDGGDGDDETSEEHGEGVERSGGDGGLEKEKSVPAVAKDDSYQDALDDHQLMQKALSLANDAKAEGNALFKDGKYEDALSKYESALQVAPEIPKPKSAPQVVPNTLKNDSAVQVESESHKSASATQVSTEKPKESNEQVMTEKPKQKSDEQVAPEMTEVVELRSICHFNRAVCFLKLGKYDDSVKECSKALELNPAYLKALRRRGEAYEKLERYQDAINDMKKILELDPLDTQAKRNINRLQPLAEEKMKQMTEEMMGKMKDLGNSILGRFGMSVDNFKAVKDPNTGSYSISFQR